MNDIKISIIIPVYNAAKFLPRCLDSILSQDYPNLEVVCVNDGSQDESLSILHIYAQKDARVKVFSQFNQGAAAARNKGLKQASGDYVSFIDADDFISQGLYHYFISAVKDDLVDIFMFNGLVNNSMPFFSEKNFYHPTKELQNVNYKDFYGIFFGNSSVCNKIFKNSLLKHNKISFIKGSCFEDVDFWFKSLIVAQKIKVSFKNFYHYCFDNNNSVTKTLGRNAYGVFDMFLSLKNAAQKQGLEDFFQDALFQYQYEKIIETLGIMKPEFQEKFFYKAQEYLKNQIIKLKGNSYKKLLDIGVCYNLLLNDFVDFKNTTLLFKAPFEYRNEKPEKVKFSVIVPIYNVERYLGVCLKSLINQTFADFEIICVNDGSTDRSLQILDYFAKKDKRIKIINQENKGLGAARNVGVSLAEGEYLVFVDSDDWLRTDALEILSLKINESFSDVYLFGYNKFDEINNICIHMQIFDQIRKNISINQMEILDFMFVSVTAWGKIYNRKFWLKNKLNFAENVFFEDTLTNSKVFYFLEKMDICWDNLYYYRLSQDSITRKMFTEQKIQDLFDAFNKTFQFLVEKQIYNRVKNLFINYSSNCLNYYLQQIPDDKKAKYKTDLLAFYKKIQK